MAKAKVKAQLRNDDFLIAIGENIRTIRLRKGMSQTELALACKNDLDYSQISRMERGVVNFSISYLKIVAEALEVEPQELLP